jgi:hypothetical protein
MQVVPLAVQQETYDLDFKKSKYQLFTHQTMKKAYLSLLCSTVGFAQNYRAYALRGLKLNSGYSSRRKQPTRRN